MIVDGAFNFQTLATTSITTWHYSTVTSDVGRANMTFSSCQAERDLRDLIGGMNFSSIDMCKILINDAKSIGRVGVIENACFCLQDIPPMLHLSNNSK